MNEHGKTRPSKSVRQLSNECCLQRRYCRRSASSLVAFLMTVMTHNGLVIADVPESIPVRIVAQPAKGFPWEIFASGILGLLSAIVAFLVQQAVQRRRKVREERATVVQMLRGISSELALNGEVLCEISERLREGKLPSKKMSSLTYISFHSELVRLLKRPVLLQELQSVYHQFEYLCGILEKIGQNGVKLQMLHSIANIAGPQIDSVAKLRALIEAHIGTLDD